MPRKICREEVGFLRFRKIDSGVRPEVFKESGGTSPRSSGDQEIRNHEAARNATLVPRHGHSAKAVGAFLEQHALRYHVVNPLATFRVREARQMGRDKRDLTDAEQIAQLLRTGVVTQCQLLPATYMQLRRGWGEYHRLRRERHEPPGQSL